MCGQRSIWILVRKGYLRGGSSIQNDRGRVNERLRETIKKTLI